MGEQIFLNCLTTTHIAKRCLLHDIISSNCKLFYFIVLALTRFEALCGFRPASEVLNYLHDVPEFLAVVGQPAADHLINAEHAHSGIAQKFL